MIRVEHIAERAQFRTYLEEIKARLYPEQVLPYTLSSDGDNEYIINQLVLFERAEPVAGLCLYANPGVHHGQLKTLQVGNYECIESDRIAKKLFETVFDYGRQNGYAYILGPMNGSTWYNYRFKSTFDNPNFFLEAYHQPYYLKQFADSGFDVVSRYISAVDYQMDFHAGSLQQIENKLIEQGVVFRLLNIDNLENELKQVHKLSISAFTNNAYYTPLSWESFWEKNKKLASRLDPQLFLVAEKNGEIIAYLFAIEDYFNTSIKQVVVKTLAVKAGREYQGTGFILLNKLIAHLRENKYRSIVHAYMFEDNTVIRMSGKYSHELYSRYSLFGRKL